MMLFFPYILHFGQYLLLAALFNLFILFMRAQLYEERIALFEMIYNLLLIIFLSYSVEYLSFFYFDIALAIGLFGFISGFSLAKFLRYRAIID